MITTSDRKFSYHQFKHTLSPQAKMVLHTNANHRKQLQLYISKVESDYAPTEEFEYKKKSLSKDLHIVKKKINNRFLDIDYYQIGSNRIGAEQGYVLIKYNDDFQLDRVKKLRAPVGTTNKPITTHRFLYYCNYKPHSKRKEILDGYTEVFDALHHQTRYDYDKEHRLTSLTRYSGTNEKPYQPYCKESFEWGTGKDEGNLVKKTFSDQNSVHHYRTFEYDDRGNVIRSILHGNLTDKETAKRSKPIPIPMMATISC